MSRIGSDYNIQLARKFLSENRSAYSKALEPLATGRRINRPSDDPARLAEYFVNLGRSKQIEQYKVNLNTARTKISITDGILSEMGGLLNEAYSLAITGNNQGSTTQEKEFITSRLADIKEDLLNNANSKSNNDYIFAGYKSDTIPFSGEPVAYFGDSNIQYIKVSESKNIQVTIDADEAFLGGGSGIDIFDAIDQTIAAIEAEDDVGLGALITDLQLAVDQISATRAELANSMKSLDTTEQNLQNLLVQTSERIAVIGDVDIAEATTHLSFQEYTLKSSLAITQRVMEIQLQSFFQ